jgi:uncharacterized membrane protein YcfT
MPDFFLISGLFLARVIERDWRSYLDRRVVHFAYFYLLWMTLQIGLKAPILADKVCWAGLAKLYALSFIDPFGILWFIYLLPVFFALTKLTRKMHPAIVWLAAAALEVAHVESEWTLVIEFARRFVYFYSGYLLAPYVFKFAAGVAARPAAGLAGLGAWALLNGVFVAKGWSSLPFVSLALGLAGATAVISAAALMAKLDLFPALRYLGEKSLFIYLAFFLPMGAMRTALIKSGVIADLAIVSLIVTVASILGALVIYWLVRDTRLFGFLFERPRWARVDQARKVRLQPAE